MFSIFILLQYKPNLHSTPGGGVVGVRDKIATPLVENFDTIYAFIMIYLFLYALVIANRIYAKWQMGEENALIMIYRWLGGLLVVAILLTFLKAYINTRNFGGINKPTINVSQHIESRNYDGFIRYDI